MDLISPSLLAVESSDESSAENETPMSKPPKKLKLSVPKDKENR